MKKKTNYITESIETNIGPLITPITDPPPTPSPPSSYGEV
jgi:hypothetical protein